MSVKETTLTKKQAIMQTLNKLSPYGTTQDNK